MTERQAPNVSSVMLQEAINQQSTQGGQVQGQHRWRVLAILTLISIMSFVDRQILAALIEPIRRDLHLSDTQIGLVAGLSFSLTYVTCSIPAAHIADRWSRRNVIVLAVTVWSLMTMVGGLAQNFVQLFLARLGVGFGEAGGTPPSNALISEHFPRDQRVIAMSIFVLACPVGMGLGLLTGSLVEPAYGWRIALAVAGAPGFILALALLLVARDTKPAAASPSRDERAERPLREVLDLFRRTGALRNMVLAVMLQTIITQGLSTWIPSYLARSRHLPIGESGKGLAAALMIGLAAGTVLGGWLATALGKLDLRWHFRVPAIAVLGTCGCSIAAILAPTEGFFWLYGLALLIGALFAGQFGAITQSLAPAHLRATVSACALMVVNLVSMGLGPQVIGIVSDLFHPHYGENSLGLALIFGSLLALPAAIFYYLASLTYEDDFKRARFAEANP